MGKGKLWDDLTLGPARRRREMHRRLRQLDRLDAQDDWTPGSLAASSTRSGFRSERARTVFVAATTAALVVGATALTYVDRSGTPLGRPPSVGTGPGSFQFIDEQLGQPGSPVAYDPCEPVRFVVSDRDAPPHGDVLLDEAIDIVSTATGLQFSDEGSTEERARERRGLRDLTRYGADWSPVLIAWTSPEEVPDLEGDIAGVAGSASVEVTGVGRRFITGTVYLDAPQLERVLDRRDGTAQVRAIIMHELGHLVGLDHVDDPGELMHADNIGLQEFGPGDRQGLSALGAGRCFPDRTGFG